MASKHLGVKVNTHGGYGPHDISVRGHHAGRVEPAGNKGHLAIARVPGAYKKIGHFPTRKAAIDAVARSHNPAFHKPAATKLKRGSIFKKRGHPTQSLGV